ncbi:hypothetical protein EYC84_010867 [Monilinia fructicola]|uniref:Uncharacterized protein n=1 Tax=Monilinia fructicola TaxID=38448 RepID=A0A5M9J6H7_MONFR|nr:hypothetical protein EYC84_010867 [Monilinia fructicola]
MAPPPQTLHSQDLTPSRIPCDRTPAPSPNRKREDEKHKRHHEISRQLRNQTYPDLAPPRNPSVNSLVHPGRYARIDFPTHAGRRDDAFSVPSLRNTKGSQNEDGKKVFHVCH